jgi:NitT/TauT family transport system substrate-binding protein
MMRRVLALVSAALLGYSSAPAAEIHLSHFGQVMVSVPWIIALEQDLFRKNGVDVTDIITSQGGGTTLRNMLAGGVPFAVRRSAPPSLASLPVCRSGLSEPPPPMPRTTTGSCWRIHR